MPGKLAWVAAAAALVLGIPAALLLVPGGEQASDPPRQISAPESDGRIRLRPAERLRVTGPDGQVREIASLLPVTGRQDYGSYTWNDTGVPRGPAWVRVDLAAQTVSVIRAGEEIGTAVILHGAGDKPTPTGWFSVLEKKRDHYSRSYDAPMPWMLRLTTDGVALHESHVVAGRATHGCIGLPEAFARRLFAEMREGDRVLIVAGAEASS